jgi:hypothetical protein
MSTPKIYKCVFCNKEYTSYMGLWKHKKVKHTNEIEPTDNNNNLMCKLCKKEFSNYRNRWRHEKSYCKFNKTNNIETKNITNNIQNNNIKTQTNIQTQNNNNNININNTINISLNSLGCEDVSVLNQDEIEQVINKGLVNIVKLVELLNFHEDRPPESYILYN